MISLNFPVLLLCYIVSILYLMKTFLVMVKLQSKFKCQKSFLTLDLTLQFYSQQGQKNCYLNSNTQQLVLILRSKEVLCCSTMLLVLCLQLHLIELHVVLKVMLCYSCFLVTQIFPTALCLPRFKITLPNLFFEVTLLSIIKHSVSIKTATSSTAWLIMDATAYWMSTYLTIKS